MTYFFSKRTHVTDLSDRRHIRMLKGFTIVEVLFAAAFLAVFIGALTTAYVLYFRAATAGPHHTAAVFLADEGLEAVRSIRDGGWEDRVEPLLFGSEYHLIFADGQWSATTTPQLIDGTFTRTVMFREVRRDGDGSISDTGTVDSGTRGVDVQVTWDGLVGGSTVDLSAYIADLFE